MIEKRVKSKMLFSSMFFIWVFLPIVIIVNFILSIIPFRTEDSRIRMKNFFLLIASMIFYAWGGCLYLLIMLSSILLNYLGGRLIGRNGGKGSRRKLQLILVICMNLGILFLFKYFNMFIVIVESMMDAGGDMASLFHNMFSMQGTGALSIPQIVLPIGISFFTFQAMSYVIDVYTKKASVQKNILDFALYVSFFPQLIAGPIVKYSDIEEQLHGRKETISLFCSGQKRFCYGLGKKVLLANTFAAVTDGIFTRETASLGFGAAWLGIIAYTLQIYYDFSGYSDMAIGIGRMLGFRFKENFHYPYTALSIQEFWRRWHISLSSWFKEYVYIPLGGNRQGMGRTCFNLLIVFFLTGVWHGANFTFLAWGIFYAVLLIMERLFLKKILDKNPIRPLNWIYSMFLVMIGWVFFRSDTVLQAVEYLRQMFMGSPSAYTALSFLSMKVVMALLFGILFSGFAQRIFGARYEKIRGKLPVRICDLAAQAVILILSIFMLVSGTYNPFIYFQF